MNPGSPPPPGDATASARVQLSALGEVAGAVGLLGATVAALSDGTRARASFPAGGIGNPEASAATAARLAQAIALLDRSIGSLAALDEPASENLDFLASAGFSQRLLASGLTDSVNGRSTGSSLAALGLVPQSSGGFALDAVALERSFRIDPAGVLALIGDYARNLDGYFTARSGAGSDRSALGVPGAGPSASGGSGNPFDILGDYSTRQALVAFQANSLL